MRATLAQIGSAVSRCRRHCQFLLYVLALAVAAESAPAAAPAGASVMANPGTAQTATSNTRVLEVFVRDGCPHCADAERYLTELVKTRRDLDVVYRSIDHDAAARADLVRLSRGAGVWPPGVPTFVVGGHLLVGFTDAATTGPKLTALIEDSRLAAGQVETTLFGTLSASELGLPLFTVALGLLDGFNPCAMWVLLVLLSLLVRLQNRRRMAVIAGTFVVVSGAVYYAFMAAWLNLFLILGMTTALRYAIAGIALTVGVINVKDFVAPARGPSLSIPGTAKPGIYARARQVLQADALHSSLIAVAALAVVVNFVELLCTAGIPAIYTAVLAQHELAPATHYAYLGLYIVGYMADDSVMVTIAVLALGSRKLTELGGRWLKMLSGAVMLALGGIVLLRPGWLL